MKANELMLGDYVSHNGVVKIVVSIPNEHRVALMIPNQQWGSLFDTTPIDDVAPVEIMPDILLACGFCTSKRDNMHGLLVGNHYKVEYKKSTAQSGKVLCVQYLSMHSGYVEKTFNLPLPKYVHELQHAMKLCGIEKEIEL